ncbi:MAG: hypothetical protein SO016_09695 [Lachnospiraceae bacterium]|nr:hypothetical protein [Robinsoniella sp.]MDY3766938.1 hypothetical protein [Lachnospiraceae bacterium]
MKKRKNVIFVFLLLFVVLAGINAQAETQKHDSGAYTIGVVVYDPESAEMNMFMNYYRDYIEEGFGVKFYFSGQTYTAQAENEFISAMKAKGAQGIISFLGVDVKSTVSVCEENEMYYVLGSNTISEEDYEAVKDNPWFLGTIGPDPDAVYQAGRDMAEYFLERGAKSFVIMTGGASRGNALHAARTRGMLEVLQEKAGLVLEQTTEQTALVKENTTLISGDGKVSVILCPDYTEEGKGLENLEEAFGQGSCDALMSAFHASTYLDQIAEKEREQNANMMVGAIDSFSEVNFEAIQGEDPFGNPPIDYIQGKYGSMAGPAFAMLYNAMSGHPEANTLDGKAVRLYQGFWTAKSREEYMELYGYAIGIYENAYSCEDLMKVIKVFNEEASPEALRELTEAYTVEDVKERIL